MDIIQPETRRYVEGDLSLKSRVSGQLGVIVGLVILAIVAMAFASMATWSVEDPSFSNANGNQAQNLMGGVGATFADLMLQFFGLSAAVALIAPSIWGWLKIMQRHIGYLRSRLVAWLGGIAISAAAMAALPVPDSWPLPTGLGGVFGDLVLSVPGMIIAGFPSGFMSFFLFALFILPAAALTLYAAGILMPYREENPEEYDPVTGEYFDEDEEASWLLGFGAHTYYSAKLHLNRLWRNHVEGRFSGLDDDAHDDYSVKTYHGANPGMAHGEIPPIRQAPLATPRNGEMRHPVSERTQRSDMSNDRMPMAVNPEYAQKDRPSLIARLRTSYDAMFGSFDEDGSQEGPQNRMEPGFRPAAATQAARAGSHVDSDINSLSASRSTAPVVHGEAMERNIEPHLSADHLTGNMSTSGHMTHDEYEPDYSNSGLVPPRFGETVYDDEPQMAVFERSPAEFAAQNAVEGKTRAIRHDPAMMPQAHQSKVVPQNHFQVTRQPVMDEQEAPLSPSAHSRDQDMAHGKPAIIRAGASEVKAFELPSVEFLALPEKTGTDISLCDEALAENARQLESVLEDFGIRGEIINVRPGPVVTMYELEPAPGIKSSRVIGLADDIARSMSAIAARVAVVPGRNVIGIELPNKNRQTVYLREMLASQDYQDSKAKLAIVLGKTIDGTPTIADLAKMPHLLVAGTTGSGKSVAINTMILSLLYKFTPDQVKLIMVDPKMLELSIYDGIPHLLTPVVTDPKKAVVALKWTVREMEERYKKMSKLGVRNIDGYNQRLQLARKKGESITRTVQTGFDRQTGEAIYEVEELNLDPMPYIVVVIDEMADLMMVAGKDIEGTIQRLAQMARAAGIHVIMATQRPSVDVITGTIKANFPTRISFQVSSKIDSRTIFGEQGAEQLLGMGDMLYMAGGGRIQRVHGPFVADQEVEKVVNHLKAQGVPEYLDSVTVDDEDENDDVAPFDTDSLAESDDIYDQAVAIVLKDRKVSTSYIQRRLSIGYNRAATLIERMEQEGLISPANHAGKRDIMVPGEDETI